MACDVADNDQLSANSAFVAIDRGLLSGKVSELVESIVKFPALFDRHPFPLLINSSILKLAEVFRVGSNFTRLCILRVCQQTVRHVNKIVNVDEVVARLFSVTYSNDPVARSLVLRVFGTISAVIAERQEVRHNIRRALDSNDTVELHAAIWAAQRFVTASPSFAADIFAKVAQMVESVTIPTHTKLLLFTVLENMSQDAERANAVRQLCVGLLPSLPAERFVIANLRVLTRLAANTLVDIPEQVDLLLKYLITDVRRRVKLASLAYLQHLATHSSLMWTNENQLSLVKFTSGCFQPQVCAPALSVLTTLSHQLFDQDQLVDTDLRRQLLLLCRQFAYHSCCPLSVRAIQLYTVLATNISDEEVVCEAAAACDALLLLLLTKHEPTGGARVAAVDSRLLADTLCCARVLVVNTDQTGPAARLVDSLWSLCREVSLPMSVAPPSPPAVESEDGRGLLLLECLCAVAQLKPQLVAVLESDILQLLQLMASHSQRQLHVVRLCTLLFQTTESTLPWQPDRVSAIVVATECLNAWRCYQVARQAMRFGHHCVSVKLLSVLRAMVDSEHCHHWLNGLWRMSRAETTVAAEFPADIAALTKAAHQYSRALINLSASYSATLQQQACHHVSFVVEFCQLRSRWLLAHIRLQSACGALQTSPPPCVTLAAASGGGGESGASAANVPGGRSLRCGRVVSQLQSCQSEFEELSGDYDGLYRRSFDADPSTLTCLRALQQACMLVVDAINWALTGQGTPDIKTGDNTADYEVSLHSIRDACTRARTALGSARQLIVTSSSAVTSADPAASADKRQLCQHHVSALMSASAVLTSVPLSVPRACFQSRQSTSIALSVQPQPSALSEQVILHPLSSHLTLKVDGVVSYSGACVGIYRRVLKTRLTVTSSQQGKTTTAHNATDGKVRECSIRMQRVVTLVNDYFRAEFLLDLFTVGMHQVNIQVEAIDANQNSWSMACDQQLMVKVFDETVSSTSRR